MENITAFIGILGVLCLGIMSPGPSFVLVARTSAAPRKIYLNLKKSLDRVASIIIGGLGAKLILEAKSA